jgi:NADH dehydrogenase
VVVYLLANRWSFRHGPGVWALGDCSAIPDPRTDGFYPPTARHAFRQGRIVAENIIAAIRGTDKNIPFLDNRAARCNRSPHRRANVLGINFSGFIAWWLWRTIYLSKLPRFEKKLRVAFDWTLDLIFSKDIVQFLDDRPSSGMFKTLAAGSVNDSEPLAIAGDGYVRRRA